MNMMMLTYKSKFRIASLSSTLSPTIRRENCGLTKSACGPNTLQQLYLSRI